MRTVIGLTMVSPDLMVLTAVEWSPTGLTPLKVPLAGTEDGLFRRQWDGKDLPCIEAFVHEPIC